MRKQHVVVLPEPERARLHTLIGQGTAPARVLTHARSCSRPTKARPALRRPCTTPDSWAAAARSSGSPRSPPGLRA